VVQPRRRPRLADEPFAQLGREQPLRPWNLQRHLPAQLGVGGQKDHAEGAVAQLAVDLEAAQPA
jgi:hypothetical protein